MESVNNLAPIALFAFNRPDHLEQTLNALKANELASESILYIFCDGPREGKDDVYLTQRVRELANSVKGFREVQVISHKTNKGLAQSIIDGVSKLCNEFGCVIVLEDDIVTSKYFLKYMNDGLAKYHDQEQIISLHGYIYPLRKPMPSPFFLRGADCWGWATWKRGWKLFNPNGEELLHALEKDNSLYRFNFNNSYDYFQMLKDQIEGKNNSWAIRWYASAFLKKKLTLYPHVSLVHNIGLDNSGTNCSSEDIFSAYLANFPLELPEALFEENLEGVKRIHDFFLKRKSLFYRFITKVKKLSWIK